MDAALELAPRKLQDAQALCRQLSDGDPRCRRLSLTSCFVGGTFDDSLCDQLAVSLRDNTIVSELVVASPPMDPGSGARRLATWVSGSANLRKLIIFAHTVSMSSEVRHAISTKIVQGFTSFASLFLSATCRLTVLDLRLIAMDAKCLVDAIHSMLVSTSSLQELRLGFSDLSERSELPVGQANASIALEECRLLTRGLALNSTLTSVTLLHPPALPMRACLDGLRAHEALRSLTVERTEWSEEPANPVGSFLSTTNSLQHLCLRLVTVSPPFWDGLATNCSLEHLEMDSMLPPDVCSLKHALEQNVALQRLHLSQSQLGGEAFVNLIPALVGRRVVSLSHCSIEDQIDSLRPLLMNQNLTRLDLSGNSLGGVVGVRQLADGLVGNATLQELDLSACQLGDDKITVLVDCLPHLTALTSWNVECNQIGVSGARALARCFQHPELRVLDASFNSIQDEGAAVLAEALVASRLEVLNIADCEIRDLGLSSFAHGLLGRTGRTRLRIDGNRFTPAGYRSLTESIPRIVCLQELSIDLPIESDECMNEFVSSILANKSLESIHQTNRDLNLLDAHVDAMDFAVCRNRMFNLMESEGVPKVLWPSVISWANRRCMHRNASGSAIFCAVKTSLAPILTERLVSAPLVPQKRRLGD